MKARIAAGIAVVLFLVLAGTGVSNALWSTNVTTGASVQAASLAANCTPASRLTNGSFETKVQSGTINQVDPANVAPWQTTDTQNKIEIWRANNFQSVPPAVGDQFAELNANSDSTLYQTIATTPGQTIRWSLLHRGRSGVDTMRVSIGGVSQGTYTAGNAAWVRHEGVYTVPANQNSTLFEMTAVSTASGDNTIGNFIDDVSFGSGPCLTAASAVAPTGTSNVGDTLTYTTNVTNTGGSVSLTSVYSTVLPAGIEYVANSAAVGSTAAGALAGYDSASRTLTVRLGLNATAAAGGTIAPDQVLAVNFKAVVQNSAAGQTVNYSAQASFADWLAPSWPMTVTANTVAKTIAWGSDIEVTTLATPTLVGGSTDARAVWSFTVKNNGPLAATGVSVALAVPASISSATATFGTSSASGTQTTCGSASNGTARTCAIGGLAVGASQVVTVTRAMTTAQKTTAGTAYTVTAAGTSTTNDTVPANNSASNAAVVTDTVKPNAPVLALDSATTTQINLEWPVPGDNVGVVSYKVYRGGVFIGDTSTPSYSDTGRTAGTAYVYTAVAYDAAGNFSATSAQFAASTAFDPNSVYRINYPRATNYCLDLSSADNGGYVEIDPCATNVATQNFRLTGNVNGYYSFVANAAPTRSWNLVTGNATNATQVISTTADFGQTRALWSPVAVLDGTAIKYQIVNSLSGKCIDVNGQSTTAGTNVQQYDCNRTIAQYFTFTKVN
jgi:uncharacterized repeat protein (TIGR01451 family)